MNEYRMKLDWDKPVEEVKTTVMNAAEEYSRKNNLEKRDSSHLRLAAEETMEMVRLLKDRRPEELCLEMEDETVILHLITRTRQEGTRLAGPADYAGAQGISGKLRLLYETTYEDLEKDSANAEEIGVRKASREDLKEIGIDDSSDAYVWSLQAYDLSVFDRIMEDDEEGWQEVSHSILANLSEDIRLFIFPDKTELDIRLSVSADRETADGKYAISPEFEELYKVPVVKSRFQVKLVQLMYGGLPNKQKSSDRLEVRKMKFSTGFNKKGELTALRYTPIGAEDNSPAVIFFHGGADLFPALPYHYRLAASIAKGACCRVFLLMHDLAPKYNPPVQIREGLDVYRILLEEGRYFIDPKKVVVMGDSSGGTMAAAVALLARDGLAPAPAAQMLLYPSLDMRYNTPSMKKYTDVPVVNAEAIDFYRKIVRTDWSKGNKYYLSPTEADSFEGLCPAYIETAEFDALHDEGVEYAKKLKAAGVPVVLNETRGTVHSFDMAMNSQIYAEALTRRIEFLKDVFK